MLLKNVLFKVENRNTQALEQDATSLVSLTHITFARPVILGTQWICSGQGHCGLEAAGIGSPCIRPLLLLRWPRTAEKCCRVCAVHQGFTDSMPQSHLCTCQMCRLLAPLVSQVEINTSMRFPEEPHAAKVGATLDSREPVPYTTLGKVMYLH